MAKETVVRLIDDVDGSTATQTLAFSWQGAAYEIDLNEKNAAAFATAVEPYLAASTKLAAARGRRGTARPAATNGITKAKTDAIREWAKENGQKVADRGRIAVAVVDAYDKAQAAPVKPAPRPIPVKVAIKKAAPAKKAAGRKAASRALSGVTAATEQPTEQPTE